MKTLKKAAVATMIASAMVVSSAPAFAAETDSKWESNTGMIDEDQVIAKVRELFGVPHLQHADATYWESDGMVNRPSWTVRLSAQEPSPAEQGPQEFLHAVLDAKTGELIMFNHLNPDWAGEETPSTEIALPAANEFLAKAVPDLVPKIQFHSADSSGSSHMAGKDGEEGLVLTHRALSFVEMVNGIPFESNYISLQVDQYGHVVGMHREYGFDAAKLPDRSQAISLEQATQAFSDSIKMVKHYLTDGQDNQVLAYYPLGLTSINAITGKPEQNLFGRDMQNELQRYEVAGKNRPLIAADKEAAQRIVAEWTGLDLAKMLYRETEQLDPFRYGVPVRMFNWDLMPTAEQPPVHVSAVFHAETGQLLTLNKSTSAEPPEQPAVLSFEEGKIKALQFVQNQLQDGDHELFLSYAADQTKPMQLPDWFRIDESNKDWFSNNNTYDYSFNLGHQGVPISNANYHVQIDAATGQIVNLAVPSRSVWVLPDNADTVTPEAAKAEFVGQFQLELVYTWPSFMGQSAPEGELVYRYRQPAGFTYIDAFTGKAVTRRPQ